MQGLYSQYLEATSRAAAYRLGITDLVTGKTFLDEDIALNIV